MTDRLRADGVGVRFDGAPRPALDDVSMTVRVGEVHALVGPNGAGKSTLFAVLAGDVAPTAGRVTLDGDPVDRLRPRDLARRRAVLLQESRVTFPFTVEQVVRMGRAPWARTPAEDEDDDAVAEALAAADLDALRDRTLPALSGGERARTALARVLAQRVDVLLLDEPTAALDLRHQEDVLRLVRARADAGAAVAIVVHDLNAALAYADRVTLLAAGRVAASGTPATVLTSERIETVYGQPVEVIDRPGDAAPIIVPRRGQR